MNSKQPRVQSAAKYAQVLSGKALRFGQLYEEYRFQEALTRSLRQSVGQTVRSYWAKNKSSFLQELVRHALVLSNLHSSKATPDSEQSRPEQTNMRFHDACNIINSNSALSFESVAKWVYDITITLQRLLAISERLMAVSFHSSTYLMSATVLDEVSYCSVCLD